MSRDEQDDDEEVELPEIIEEQEPEEESRLGLDHNRLDTNELNDLGTQEEAEAESIKPQDEEPLINFKEAIKYRSGDCELEVYSSTFRIDYLASVFLELKKELSNSKDKNNNGSSYFG